MVATFEVGLIVTSRSLSLMELARPLGQEPAAGSHNKGDARIDGSRWETTVLWLNTRAAGAGLLAQCLQVLGDMPPKCAELAGGKADDLCVSLDVAAFYEGAYFNVVLPSDLIRELASKGVDVEITVYPVVSQEDSESCGDWKGR